MTDHNDRSDRSEERRQAEGVRIIGADEAQKALDAGQASGRRADDELRYGDVPPVPSGPRPPRRFPLPDSVDPAEMPRPPVAPLRTEPVIKATRAGSVAPSPPEDPDWGATEGVRIVGAGAGDEDDAPVETEPSVGEDPAVQVPAGEGGPAAPPVGDPPAPEAPSPAEEWTGTPAARRSGRDTAGRVQPARPARRFAGAAPEPTLPPAEADPSIALPLSYDEADPTGKVEISLAGLTSEPGDSVPPTPRPASPDPSPAPPPASLAPPAAGEPPGPSPDPAGPRLGSDIRLRWADDPAGRPAAAGLGARPGTGADPAGSPTAGADPAGRPDHPERAGTGPAARTPAPPPTDIEDPADDPTVTSRAWAPAGEWRSERPHPTAGPTPDPAGTGPAGTGPASTDPASPDPAGAQSPTPAGGRGRAAPISPEPPTTLTPAGAGPPTGVAAEPPTTVTPATPPPAPAGAGPPTGVPAGPPTAATPAPRPAGETPTPVPAADPPTPSYLDPPPAEPFDPSADERDADVGPPEERITVTGSHELPHWTEPPGGLPANLADPDGSEDDLDAWNALGTQGARWRSEHHDWEDTGGDVGFLAGDDVPLGALDQGRSDESDIYSFDEAFERLEEERSGSHPVVNVVDEVDDDPEPAADSSAVTTTLRRARTVARPHLRRPGGGGAGDGGGRRPEPRARTGASSRDVAGRVGVGVGLAVVLVIAYLVGPIGLLVVALAAVVACAAESYRILQHLGRSEARTDSGFRPATLLGLVAVAGLMLAGYWKGSGALPVVLAVTFVAVMVWYLVGVTDARPLANVAVTVMTVLWVGLLGSFAALMLREPHGRGLFFGAVAVAVVSDVVAYFAGRRFGHRPLAPRVSPGKTVEGLLAGAVAAIVVGALVGHFLSPPWGGVKDGLALGVVVAVLAPVGDLFESLIKRDLDVKDSGTVLAGHGGLLDRFDSLLVVLPAAYYLATALHLA